MRASNTNKSKLYKHKISSYIYTTQIQGRNYTFKSLASSKLIVYLNQYLFLHTTLVYDFINEPATLSLFLTWAVYVLTWAVYVPNVGGFIPNVGGLLGGK